MKKVLIVDDSLFTRNIHKQMVEGEGYLALEAEDGAAALVAFEKEKPDLVMVDLMMLDMDGMDLIKKIFDIDPMAKTIICSTDRQKTRRQEAKKIGVKEFLAKPLDTEKLSKTLKDLLG